MTVEQYFNSMDKSEKALEKSVVFGLNTEDTQDVKNYTALAEGVFLFERKISALEKTRDYVTEGRRTTRAFPQIIFTIGMERVQGDKFQEYLLGEKIKYGQMEECVTEFFLYDPIMQEAEKGRCSINVHTTSGTDADSPTIIIATLSGVGKVEVEDFVL